VDYPIKTLSQLRPILQGFRKAAGLTQAAMAGHLGVTQQTYAQLEANPAAVSVERLFKALRILQVDLKLAPGAAEGDVIEQVTLPAVDRAPARRAAKKETTAATRGATRATQAARDPQSAPDKPARAASEAKQSAATGTRGTRGKGGKGSKRAPEPSRVAAKAAAGKKREDW